MHDVYMAATLRGGGELERLVRRAHEALEQSSASSVAFTRWLPLRAFALAPGRNKDHKNQHGLREGWVDVRCRGDGTGCWA